MSVSGSVLQGEVRTGAMHAVRKNPPSLRGSWAMGCMSVIVVKDGAAVIQGSSCRGTWMSYRGDWILLSRQGGDPEGVWTYKDH